MAVTRITNEILAKRTRMLKLDSSVSLESFLHWWGSELAFLLPEQAKTFFGQKRARLVVRPIGEKVRLMLESAERGEVDLGEFPLNEAGREAREELFRDDPELRDAEFVVRLDHSHGLCRIITLPAATEENLDQVMAFEMNRYTPFQADQVYYAARVIDKVPDANQIKVEFIFVLRKTLELIYEDMIAWGLRPAVVDHAEAAVALRPRQTVNLLPEHLRPPVARGPRIVNSILGGFLILLVLASVAFPFWLDYSLITDLEEEVNREGRLAKEVEAIKEEADTLVEQARAVMELKLDKPPLTAMMESLTSLLPDNTWLTSLQYEGQKLQIQGQSPAASALIEIMEASPMFEHTTFISPVTQDRLTGLERFQISTDLRKGSGRSGDSAD